MSILTEFKSFAVKRNVVDLAAGVIIGAAFGGIVSSLVADVMMPPLGQLTAGIGFSKAAIVLKEATADGKAPAVVVGYGNFIYKLINFVIIALVVFLVVKGINAPRALEASTPAGPAAPTPQAQLLTEIRDLLRHQGPG